MSDVSIIARSVDDEESCISDDSGEFRLQNLKPNVEYTISVLNVAPIRASWPNELRASIAFNKETNDFADLRDVNFFVFK